MHCPLLARTRGWRAWLPILGSFRTFAIADYDKAIAIAPNVATAYTNRGVAYGGKGGYDRAIADFDEAIKLNPNDANAYYNRGLAYKKKGDKEQAIADFRKALEIDPSYQKAKIILKALGVTP